MLSVFFKSSLSTYMIISDIILIITLWTQLMREIRKA